MPARFHRVWLMLDCAAILYGTAVAVGAIPLLRAGMHELMPFAAVMVVPGTAVMLLLLAGLLLPNLFATQKIAYPLNLTLPLLHGILTGASLLLWTRAGVSLEAANPSLAPAAIWLQPVVLGTMMALQCAILSVVAYLRR